MKLIMDLLEILNVYFFEVLRTPIRYILLCLTTFVKICREEKNNPNRKHTAHEEALIGSREQDEHNEFAYNSISTNKEQKCCDSRNLQQIPSQKQNNSQQTNNHSKDNDDVAQFSTNRKRIATLNETKGTRSIACTLEKAFDDDHLRTQRQKEQNSSLLDNKDSCFPPYCTPFQLNEPKHEINAKKQNGQLDKSFFSLREEKCQKQRSLDEDSFAPSCLQERKLINMENMRCTSVTKESVNSLKQTFCSKIQGKTISERLREFQGRESEILYENDVTKPQRVRHKENTEDTNDSHSINRNDEVKQSLIKERHVDSILKSYLHPSNKENSTTSGVASRRKKIHSEFQMNKEFNVNSLFSKDLGRQGISQPNHTVRTQEPLMDLRKDDCLRPSHVKNRVKTMPTSKEKLLQANIAKSRPDKVSVLKPSNQPSRKHEKLNETYSDEESKGACNYRKISCFNSNKIWKPPYNWTRQRKYQKTNVNSHENESILQFYTERVTLDNDVKNETHNNVDGLIDSILNHEGNRGRFATEADIEGSNAVGVKIGKADELDYSVDILIDWKRLKLSDSPFTYEFQGDDIDSFDKTEISTIFVDAGKRYFPDEDRLLCDNPNCASIRTGYKAVKISQHDYSRFWDCCIQTKNGRGSGWIMPYFLLSEFHQFVGEAVQGLGGVSLNRGTKGPAVTLTIQQFEGPNISVDVTPKLTLPNEKMSVLDFGWPRHDTRKWLTEEKIDSVISQYIYLVPKGDKYWKISYANCEYELLKDIDGKNTWRKACLRIVKKKLMQWKSKSTTGLNGISSYLLKTTLLWLCEILPEDDYWLKEMVAGRYLNFLQEFSKRLHKGKIGEYFNPSVNLLENTDDACIAELQQFIDEEISLLIQ